MKPVFAVLKVLYMALWSLPLVAAQVSVLPFHKGRKAYKIPHLWHKGICFCLGLKTEIRGTPVTDRQVIYIGNHLSYLDIPAVGSYLEASFIAKDDIASWPVIGFLASVQQTAFISRSSAKAKKVANALDNMLRDGKSLILFPEGTSSPGTSVLPFKSSLFALAQPKEGAPVAIQPFVLELLSVDAETPPSAAGRDKYAWYGDMEFGPHIADFLQSKGATVRLTFLDVIEPDGRDRKELCKAAEAAIVSGLSASESLEEKK